MILLYDEIFPPEPEVPDVATSFKKPNRPRKKPVEENNTLSDISNTQAPVDGSLKEENKEENKEEATISSSTSNDEAINEPVIVPESTSNTEESASTTVQTDVDTGTSTTSEDNSSAQTATEESSTDSTFIDSSTEEKLDSNSTSDTVDETVKTENTEDLTEKVLQDLESQVKTTNTVVEQKEYVAPPDYEFVGRGLVYNCIGKHWACVDGASYKICQTNHASIKYLKKSVECFPENVYETQGGCEQTQSRKIISNTKTDFCSND